MNDILYQSGKLIVYRQDSDGETLLTMADENAWLSAEVVRELIAALQKSLEGGT